MTDEPGSADSIGSEDVAAFLRANPAWLAQNLDLYRVLHPPSRLHGEALADHMAAMLAQERAFALAECARADRVLAAGRAAAGLAALVQEAVLGLIATSDPVEFVHGELPVLLGIDAASLCAEPGRPGAHALPPGTIRRLLGPHEVVFRDAPSDTARLHGAAAPLARVDALVRLSGGGLLALASREPNRLHPGQGASPLAFLGRAVSAALQRQVAA